MASKKPFRAAQETPQEVRDALLAFIRGKLYASTEADWLAFEKDKPRLLKWVVLWPAKWLNERGVTLPTDRYREIIQDEILDAMRHGKTGRIAYRPAWLAKVIQDHFRHRAERYYEEGKDTRARLEHTLTRVLASADAARRSDPVGVLADAQALISTAKKAKKKAVEPGVNGQLSLF